MGHDECAALCEGNRRTRRATRGESFATGGSPKAGAAAEPTLSDVADEPNEKSAGDGPTEPSATEPQDDEVAAEQK